MQHSKQGNKHAELKVTCQRMWAYVGFRQKVEVTKYGTG